jgi:Asp-tRNA(Asn)/Glu-tRNA(Gln) amidotransferase A subunit family amidase
MPAISLPCGFDRDGLPIAARPLGEATLPRAAAAYEWKERDPQD